MFLKQIKQVKNQIMKRKLFQGFTAILWSTQPLVTPVDQQGIFPHLVSFKLNQREFPCSGISLRIQLERTSRGISISKKPPKSSPAHLEQGEWDDAELYRKVHLMGCPHSLQGTWAETEQLDMGPEQRKVNSSGLYQPRALT